VRDAHDTLFNDGTFVKIICHEVCRGADEFDAAFVRLVVGLGTLEAGQE